MGFRVRIRFSYCIIVYCILYNDSQLLNVVDILLQGQQHCIMYKSLSLFTAQSVIRFIVEEGFGFRLRLKNMTIQLFTHTHSLKSCPPQGVSKLNPTANLEFSKNCNSSSFTSNFKNS